MIIPFIPEDLFELNNNLQPKFDGEVVIIDNIFKNYKSILRICQNTSVEIWKGANTNTRNFKDYYDCRLLFKNNFPNLSKFQKRKNILLSLVKHYFKLSNNLYFGQESIHFNYFKHLKNNIPSNIQHYPHVEEYYNILFYIDPFENGGTAIYEDTLPFKNNEEINLLYDISNLKIKKLIKSKPNRCVIFNGQNLHGGYIKNHNTYYYNWRINAVNSIHLK